MNTSLAVVEALTNDPLQTAASVALVVGVTVAAAVALRRFDRVSRSLPHQVLAITLASLGVGATAAFVLARLMVLDADAARAAGVVLLITAGIAAVLALVAAMPLGRDVRRLEHTVRRIEVGERDVRAEVVRNDELGHVARALDELTTKLGRLEAARARYERERQEMLSSVGHDLRTPLSALRAAVEALTDGVASDPERYLRSMQLDIDALSGLVDDVFLLATLDAGRLELAREPVDLTEIADGAVEALSPVATARGVRVELAAPGHVRVEGNAASLGRVIRNLVDNAIRHAPAASTVRVVVTADATPTVRVIDDGPGFPPSFASRAFDEFTRADTSRNRTTGGAGLGLAIARGLVEAHGGHIWIDGAPGGRVAFALPACSPGHRELLSPVEAVDAVRRPVDVRPSRR